MLLLGMATASNEISLNTRNPNRTVPIVATPNLFKGIKFTELSEIKFPERQVKGPPKYDGARRLDNETLDQFINFIYENIKISEVVNKKFVKSIIDKESERYVYAKSEVGARGLMQLMPDTWDAIGEESNFYTEAFNPHKNLEKGIKYLEKLNNYYCKRNHPKWNELSTKDKQSIIAAAYNGGIGRLIKNDWDISKMPLETQSYVKKVMNFNP